jgi:hypothetical protein
VEWASTEKKVDVVSLRVTKAHRALNEQVRSFVISALDWVGGQRHNLAALTPEGKKRGTPCTGGRVGPRAGLDVSQIDCQFIALNRQRVFHKNSFNYREEQN